MRQREHAPIRTTLDLVATINGAIPTPARFGSGHPARRVFQALRIAVNDELGEITRALQDAVSLLAPGIQRVILRYGFMESPNIPKALEELTEQLNVRVSQASYFLGREVLVPGMAPKLSWWRRALFLVMARNAVSATEFFRIPSDRVVELGVRIAI